MNLLGQILATAMLGLEEAGLGYSNEATIPQDISTFVQGIIQIWAIHPAGAGVSTANASNSTAVTKIS